MVKSSSVNGKRKEIGYTTQIKSEPFD